MLSQTGATRGPWAQGLTLSPTDGRWHFLPTGELLGAGEGQLPPAGVPALPRALPAPLPARLLPQLLCQLPARPSQRWAPALPTLRVRDTPGHTWMGAQHRAGSSAQHCSLHPQSWPGWVPLSLPPSQPHRHPSVVRGGTGLPPVDRLLQFLVDSSADSEEDVQCANCDRCCTKAVRAARWTRWGE